MGWDGYEIKLWFTLDAHGGDKEKEHRKLYAECKQELETLIRKYAEIMPGMLDDNDKLGAE